MRTQSLLFLVLNGFATRLVTAEIGHGPVTAPLPPVHSTYASAPPKYHTPSYVSYAKPSHTYYPPTPSHTYGPKPHPPALPSLEDALIAAGCSKFLTFIQSDEEVWALYNSPRVQTVFAPDDSSFNTNLTLRRRDELTPAQLQQADLSADTQLTDLSTLRLVPGTVVTTNDNSANLLGSPQVVVSETDSTGAVKIASGLGALVALKNPDLAYAGGLIQVISALFTNPQLLSLTAAATDNTQKFASILASAATANSNLTSRQTGPSLDLTPRITVFIPSDAAFAAANAAANSVSGSGAQKLLDGHVVVAGSIADPVGYLPELKSGQVLETKAGGSLTVSVGGDGSYYVNGAKIEKANIILPNGVAHVVDKVLSQPLQTAAAMPIPVGGAARNAWLAAGVAAAVPLAFA